MVEDSEIDGNGSASVAILPGSYTLRRVDIYDVRDGPRIATTASAATSATPR